MSSVVADTHALIWYFQKSPNLSTLARTALLNAIESGNFVYLSAITIIEMTYLVEKGRFPELALTRLTDVISDPNSGIVVAPVHTEIAIALRQIPKDTVPDMPDRIIAATALQLGLPLLSCDHKIAALTVIQTIW